MASLLVLAGCGGSRDSNQGATNETPADATLDNALGADADAEAVIAPEYAGTLEPPAPGEPGGLPDDREPLNEGAARNPASVEASGGTIERWGIALGEGNYAAAYKLWADDGRQSGMSEAQFAETWRKYGETHVLVGRPAPSGANMVSVPVQVYGRMRADGKPFNLAGRMILTRNADGQPAWLIGSADLKPLGTVKIVPAAGSAATTQIPAAFRGNWSGSLASCGKPGDDMRLQVTATSLVFYESVGAVTAVKRIADDRIGLKADYEGEGDTWSESATLALSDGGNKLSLGKVARVRCA